MFSSNIEFYHAQENVYELINEALVCVAIDGLWWNFEQEKRFAMQMDNDFHLSDMSEAEIDYYMRDAVFVGVI